MYNEFISLQGPGYQDGAFLLYTPLTTTKSDCKPESQVESFEDLKQRDLQNVEDIINML